MAARAHNAASSTYPAIRAIQFLRVFQLTFLFRRCNADLISIIIHRSALGSEPALGDKGFSHPLLLRLSLRAEIGRQSKAFTLYVGIWRQEARSKIMFWQTAGLLSRMR